MKIKRIVITKDLAFRFEQCNEWAANCHIEGERGMMKYNHLIEMAKIAISVCGIPTLFCAINEDARNIRLFISALGFKRTGEIPNFYGNKKSLIYTRIGE